MCKTAIATVTAGDFEYIDEWIEYHHNKGVDLFLIAYNGPSNKIKNYKEREYVKIMDFSYNENYKKNLYDENFTGFEPIDKKIEEYSNRQCKINYILLLYLRLFFKDFNYCCFVETDEFIDTKKYDNINLLLDENFNKDLPFMIIGMDFYNDNNLIFKENKPCLERFTNIGSKFSIQNENSFGVFKTIINLNNEEVKNGNLFMNNPHIPSYDNVLLNTFNENIITLKHFWCKTIEEWIEKLNPEIDPDYFKRFGSKKEIFKSFFWTNEITKNKVKMIPYFFEKYHIIYDLKQDKLYQESELFKKYVDELS